MKSKNRSLFRTFVSASLLVSALGACQSLPPRASTDLDRLEGYWQGKGPGGECSVTISGTSLRYDQPNRRESNFWFETELTLVEAEGPAQFHARIVDNNSADKPHVGTTIVTIYQLEGEKLTLGVVRDYVEPPDEPIVGDWEWVMDIYHLERADPSSCPEGSAAPC